MVVTTSTQNVDITWELLPEDFILDDEPVDNVNQPALASALTETLKLAGKLPETALATTNYGICATFKGKMTLKAPDWAYIPKITVPRDEVKKSYTPYLQGEIPTVVMEFLSDTEGNEYSSKRSYPPGKWYFYEQILKVPNYAIFEPETGALEVHCLDKQQQYKLSTPNEDNRYWIEEIKLFLGVWRGERENRQGYWLRWWDENGNLLLWGFELIAQERQAKQVAQQELSQERQAKQVAQQELSQERQAKQIALKRLEELEQKLKEAGIEP